MRRIISISQIVFGVSVLVALLAVGLLKTSRVAAADAPSLVISQAKITSSNGQSITLYNTTGGVGYKYSDRVGVEPVYYPEP